MAKTVMKAGRRHQSSTDAAQAFIFFAATPFDIDAKRRYVLSDFHASCLLRYFRAPPLPRDVYCLLMNMMPEARYR
jgi:hypothetical protein